jgi:hypothetical protein
MKPIPKMNVSGAASHAEQLLAELRWLAGMERVADGDQALAVVLDHCADLLEKALKR